MSDRQDTAVLDRKEEQTIHLRNNQVTLNQYIDMRSIKQPSRVKKVRAK
jgi:hypothetical protein